MDATAVVNGPRDAGDWYGIDWDQAERDVGRLRQRIFAASQAGDLKKVRNLQRLMLRSRANALVGVRRVTEVNAGRKTPGVDGKVALLASQKADLADWCQRRSRLWTARPVRRVLIPKPGSAKKRALGIPTDTANCTVAQAGWGSGILCHGHAPVPSAGRAAAAGAVRAEAGRRESGQLRGRAAGFADGAAGLD